MGARRCRSPYCQRWTYLDNCTKKTKKEIMQLHIYKTTNELIAEMAKWITDYIRHVLQKQGRFTIALSGGETPKSLYKALSAEPYCSRIAWSKLHIFWGDERVVPFTDDKN